MDELFNDACPCGHDWKIHTIFNGCHEGWEYDAEGIAIKEGCMCQLSHSEKSQR
jgi:hypothetical protein